MMLPNLFVPVAYPEWRPGLASVVVAGPLQTKALLLRSCVGPQRSAKTTGSRIAPPAFAFALFGFCKGARLRGRSRMAAAGAAVQADAPPETIDRVDRGQTDKVRKAMYRSKDYYKFSRNDMARSIEDLKDNCGSRVLAALRANGFVHEEGEVTLVLAESYGFCWGVERAIAMAHEARRFFPTKTIWCTNEIIHNPSINDELKSGKGMKFIRKDKKSGRKDFSVVQEGDVVVFPAFGASIDEMALLQAKNVTIVDTTCPWVAKVWGAVESAKRKGHTSLVHGTYTHEETVATTSFAKTYVVMKTLADAEYVANYILEGGDKEEFLEKFKGAHSPGFDPDTDLVRVGMANQTTMMKSETTLMSQLFERTMIRKYGPAELKKHFISSNTICDATQDRQDAMYKMLGATKEPPQSKLYTELEEEQLELEVDLMSLKLKEGTSSAKMEEAMKGPGRARPDAYTGGVDVVMIVGGYNSSNTTHLLEIAEHEGVPGYHIDDEYRVGGESCDENVVQHKPLITPVAVAMAGEGLEVKQNFLPSGKIRVGISSGASTPDNVLEAVFERLFAIKQRMAREAPVAAGGLADPALRDFLLSA